MNNYSETLQLYVVGDEDSGYGPGGAAGSESPCYGAGSPLAGKDLPKEKGGTPESTDNPDAAETPMGPVAQAYLGMF